MTTIVTFGPNLTLHSHFIIIIVIRAMPSCGALKNSLKSLKLHIDLDGDDDGVDYWVPFLFSLCGFFVNQKIAVKIKSTVRCMIRLNAHVTFKSLNIK